MLLRFFKVCEEEVLVVGLFDSRVAMGGWGRGAGREPPECDGGG